MDRSRKATRKGTEVTLQHTSRNDAAQLEQLAEENLAKLQTSLQQLMQTPEGTAELNRRVKAFGACERIEGETSGEFYQKLHRWLDRPIPQTKLPLHPPRQVP